MGAESTSGSGESNETRVVLNVYDLTPINNYTYLFGLGILHSVIEEQSMVRSMHLAPMIPRGVFEVEPRNCPGFLYRNSIRLGKINMPPSEFWTFIDDMASEHHGLISNNCNHFSDDVLWRLTGRQVPGWVNRLARLGGLCSCLLPECLQVTPVSIRTRIQLNPYRGLWYRPREAFIVTA